MIEIQEKLFYKLHEVSRLTNLDPKIINYWEQEFPLLNAGKNRKGEKIFRPKDIKIILRIKELLMKEGFTLAGAKRKIEEEFSSKSKTTTHPDLLKKTLYRIKQELEEILTIMERNDTK
ncbi:MerR family transcriptional regulator [Candidatus Aminicenantes bacterium AH-873-B07]|jgi:DNA-binding transcriptional MerR regulator|nr:MerR family transcriptional regulator [Candidatus Aminicenantes bacterium AH-873-B07]